MSQIHHFLNKPSSWRAGIVISFLFLGFLLAACGNAATTTGGQPTPTPTTSAQTVNCGQVTKGHTGIIPSDKAAVQKAEGCFYQAYQHCQPATLTFTQASIDSGVIHTFSLKSVNGSCGITDTEQNYIAPNKKTQPVVYNCAAMQMQSDGLHIQACGKFGPVWIPQQ